MNELISVIVPVYNTGELLKKCVKSILNQEYSPIEIILVDDGSTDGITPQLCDELARKFSSVRVIHQTNGGPSKARNAGIEAARGECIAFVDSDDIIDPDAYLNLHSAMAGRDENVQLALGSLWYESRGSRSSDSRLPDGVYNREEILSHFMRGGWHSACTNLYRASLIREIRFPLGEINEDYIFNFNVILKCNNVAVVNKPFYHYVKQPDSRTGSPATLRHLDWLRHTEHVRNVIADSFGGRLRREAEYQNLFANLVLSNKTLLNMARGYVDEPSQLYRITTRNLRRSLKEILSNPFLSLRYRISALGLAAAPHLYKAIILSLLKLKR